MAINHSQLIENVNGNESDEPFSSHPDLQVLS